MVKCLWCQKKLGMLGMLFHKDVCLEYLYSKSLERLRQANLAGLIRKEEYRNEKRNLRQYFMQRFKPKVYEAFIKRQKEQQYIEINPNDLSVALESDMEMISKKVCIESQEISQKSQFLQSFQNPIDPDYNCMVNNYSGYPDIQPMFTSDDHPNNQVEFNQQDEMSIFQLEIQNIGNTHQQIDQYDNSQDQFVQLQFQQQQILHQNEEIQENQEEKPANVSLEINEEEKENVLFKLLQKKVKPNKDKVFNESFQQKKTKKQTHTRSQSRNIKQNSIISETREEKNKPNFYQEELATEVKQISNHFLQTNKKKNPPKFSQSTDKINPKINQSIEISSTKEHKKKQKKTKNLISKKTKNLQKKEDLQNSSQQDQKPKQREIIKTRHQASLSIQQNKAQSKSVNKREKQQKIKKK
ncbi:unnamed protein product (macronuclear) [Paramecium tetraurelia]|uniref:Uncharacterized protein n=1 Tax=Paramecium tetraurelia TaxID=5888 RepID=A0D8X6_PARTE|nr:uncharacterized protein GSPATT00014439001 [Paramecium tetraurelia]CAK79493.1 unnamed protein product [Paramecium tetraurelia]|eukprot:XP_001446890.1 hypothetical protein (macronuclear) [Paramecium tetraurelia strain d4-2]